MSRAFTPVLRILACAGVAVAAGCAPSAPPESKVNLAGFPPAFRDGYNDGCRSAQASKRRDDKRFT